MRLFTRHVAGVEGFDFDLDIDLDFEIYAGET